MKFHGCETERPNTAPNRPRIDLRVVGEAPQVALTEEEWYNSPLCLWSEAPLGVEIGCCG